MFEYFISYLNGKVSLTEEELLFIKSHSIVRKFKRHQFLLNEGDICRHKCFVIQGLFRSYRTTDEGVEHVLAFAPENWWTLDMESYYNELPTKMNIEALEDSYVLLWTKEHFSILIDKIPAWRQFRDYLWFRNSYANAERVYSHISFSAAQKYDDFLKRYPDIFNRVPLHMVASYLGITRETLSRVKNNKHR
ncbi:Crp/Fnr family transcriptional regulator [Chitinophaga pendula]|uniref:Crp/Fnr family transcriptional regulator n=1 Tax=Chitinophaga TaxID=79328 RepID=UPI000BAEDFD3|nr:MULTISPECIES: Crp/Fnr family transcriptional regulator [Chitinophaga]ASZ12565.1 cyclic nucleotide-binding protein [Chitinophaga sp. MD30]UCJ09833.1 Crp/Fnr family transcriptional regulator [Chitinophaga pendula]